ncbi:MAG TPA: A24 family peptidase [Mycobacterium sp.]|nr:A24 family peptidase [Mycobacterium sp.]
MGAGLAGAGLLAWLVALSAFDIRERRLPNCLTLPGAAVVLIVAVAAGRGVPALLGSAALFAVYLVVHLAAPAAMGAGDVKLAIGVGALTGSFGIDVWALSAFVAPLLTAAWAIVAVIRRTESTVPHGPSMCVAAAAGCALAVL